MAHYPKPFFRAARSLWYVQIDGRQHNLGSNKTAAFNGYHELMQHRSDVEASPQPQATPAAQQLVVVIADKFLDWCEKNRAPDTYRWYKDRINSFCGTIEASLSVDQLKPHHVQKWVDSQTRLAPGSRRNLITAVIQGKTDDAVAQALTRYKENDKLLSTPFDLAVTNEKFVSDHSNLGNATTSGSFNANSIGNAESPRPPPRPAALNLDRITSAAGDQSGPAPTFRP